MTVGCGCEEETNKFNFLMKLELNISYLAVVEFVTIFAGFFCWSDANRVAWL